VVKADTFLSVQYTWKRNRNSDFLRVPHTNNEAGHPSDYGLQDWDFIPGRGRDFFSSPVCPDQLWDPPILLYDGYWRLLRQR